MLKNPEYRSEDAPKGGPLVREGLELYDQGDYEGFYDYVTANDLPYYIGARDENGLIRAVSGPDNRAKLYRDDDVRQMPYVDNKEDALEMLENSEFVTVGIVANSDLFKGASRIASMYNDLTWDEAIVYYPDEESANKASIEDVVSHIDRNSANVSFFTHEHYAQLDEYGSDHPLRRFRP